MTLNNAARSVILWGEQGHDIEVLVLFFDDADGTEAMIS